MSDLTAERLRELLAYDAETGVFTWRVKRNGALGIGSVAGSAEKGYWRVHIDGRLYRAHRLAWLYSYGKWPADQIDHINESKSDNRLCNLREIDNAGNQQNIRRARVSSKTGIRGVVEISSGKYGAYICIAGRQRYIGVFTDKHVASRAYESARAAHFEGYIS
jgi:outer membrane protein assembly factor BamB